MAPVRTENREHRTQNRGTTEPRNPELPNSELRTHNSGLTTQHYQPPTTSLRPSSFVLRRRTPATSYQPPAIALRPSDWRAIGSGRAGPALDLAAGASRAISACARHPAGTGGLGASTAWAGRSLGQSLGICTWRR